MTTLSSTALALSLLAAAPAAGDLAVPAQVPGLRPEVLDLALAAFRRAEQDGLVDKRVLTIIDYARPSTERRLWVLDLEEGRVLFHELVSHGKNTGDDRAVRFSNVPGSRMSSLGVFRTAGTYRGRHGRSLVLEGLEPGVNDKAKERAIVVHAADYATAGFAARKGRLGRSWGCPALDPRVAMPIIDAIEGGSLVFSYFPDEGWLASSRFLEGASRLATAD